MIPQFRIPAQKNNGFLTNESTIIYWTFNRNGDKNFDKCDKCKNIVQ